ncbi:acyl carrier protein [Paenibacillus athensensis]|uniref:Carrier domain-containing protein n=1 Tax=Paenibacillus athensensis TaxID=1967502 RepID=A0A4Y8PW85_9BACL|nr:acyl carrier protein [Paenibacillus athensensis]MCD1260593.1 acyl carrier protein [Paenibacillus athensensis]
MSEDIKERVITMLRENLDDVGGLESIHPDADLSALGVNSMTFIKLVVAMEMEFGVSWDDEDLELSNFLTVNNIIDYIQSSSAEETA